MMISHLDPPGPLAKEVDAVQAGSTSNLFRDYQRNREQMDNP